MRSGPARGFRLKANGSSRREEGSPKKRMPGVMNSSPEASGWPTPGRAPVSLARHGRGRLRGRGSGSPVSSQRLRTFRHGWKRLGMVLRLVPTRQLRGMHHGGPQGRHRAQPARARNQFRPRRASRAAKSYASRRLIFLCTEQYCTRYMIGTRGKGEISSASNHLGFRCVKSAN